MKWVKIVVALVAVGTLVAVALMSNTSSNGVANMQPQVGQYQPAPQGMPPAYQPPPQQAAPQADDAERSAISNLKLR